MNTVNLLKEIQKATGWTQEELARRLNTSFATLNSWLNKRSVPRRSSAQSILQLHEEVLGADNINVIAKLKSLRIELKNVDFHPATLLNNKTILDSLTLQLTYHTNNIEGSTMTLADVSDVIFNNKSLENRTAIEQLEAINHQTALHWLINEVNKKGKEFKFTEDFIKNLHLRLMNGIVSNAGQYRKHSSRIMGSRVALANWMKISYLMNQFVSNLEFDNKNFLEHLAKSHADFEQIHPFTDGNGRTGRLIMIAQSLIKRKYPPIVIRERKNAYYAYLEKAQAELLYEPLELFLGNSILYTKELFSDI